jgi:NADH:ubiquinone oxidoreductase subunit F (NADH-binding)/ferredoxin
MGTTLRKIVFEIGGGIPEGRKFKAIQTGGPSGGCIPDKLLDLPVDFDELTKIGSMMGSGGMIVMDERNCMVDVARYFTNFLVSESCGKCVPCREGIRRMRDILVDICEGRGQEGDVDLLEKMSRAVVDGALCALGNSAPNPVMSTIRHFHDEYEAHVREKRCPAGVCKALIAYSVDAEKCTGCTLCAKVCPTKAAAGERKKAHVIDPEKCTKCGACRESCKFDAIIVR